jgi:O-antigen/teichoic acid export membrane protein
MGAVDESCQPGSIYKAILRSSLTYSAGTILSKFIGLLLVPLYTHLLSQAEYGVLELLDLTIQVMTMFLWANFSGAVSYFYTHAEGNNAKARVLSTAVWGALLIGGAGVLIGSSVAKFTALLVFQDARYTNYLVLLMLSFAFTLPGDVVSAWFRVTNRPVAFVVVMVLRLILQLSLNVVLLTIFHLGIAAILWSSVTTGAVSGLILMTYALSKNRAVFDWNIFRQMVRYSGPMIIVGLTMFVIHFGDRFVLQRYTSMDNIGVYALAYKIGMLITVIYMSFNTYWTAQVFRIMKTPSGDHLFSRVFTYVTLLLCFCALAIVVFVGPFIRLMTPATYRAAIGLAPWICGAYVLRSMGDYVRTLFYVDKRPGMDARLNICGALVATAGYFLLIPRYKALGAAIATLLSFAVTFGLAVGWSNRLHKIHYEVERLLKAVIPALMLAFLYLLAPIEDLWTRLGLGVLALLAYPVIVHLSGLFSESEISKARIAVTWARVRLKQGLG